MKAETRYATQTVAMNSSKLPTEMRIEPRPSSVASTVSPNASAGCRSPT